MKGLVSISTSKDMMTASAYVEQNDQYELTEESIMKTLGNVGIKAGIDKSVVQAIANGECFGQEVVIAKGKEAVPGFDAHFEFKFDTGQKEYHPNILDDGSVDYSFQRQLVKAGDVVAVYCPPKAGFFGYTVFADVVAPIPSKGCKELTYIGAERDENDVVALIDGEVILNGSTLSVVDYLTIDGNASNVMGDIVYKGDIHVKGDVLSGANIISTGNVYIDGSVEAANIDAGKDIVIKKGVHGQQRSLIKANGSICAFFAEEATLIAGDTIRFNYSYNSHILSMKDVIAEGRYASVIGGDVEAKNLISIGTAGNDAGVSTTLRIDETDGRVRQACMIEIKKQSFPGVELEFGDKRGYPRDCKGEYHLVHGIVRYYEFGTFEEEEIILPKEETKAKKTILLVDDEPIILKTFFTYLKNDYNVLAVSSAKDAFKVLDKTVPDLMLLDYNMPVMDGGQMLEQVRKTTWRPYHDVPVIFASAVADKYVVRKCLSLYPQGYLVKPLGEKDLKDVLTRFFADR